jgi:hypothetical protein
MDEDIRDALFEDADDDGDFEALDDDFVNKVSINEQTCNFQSYYPHFKSGSSRTGG